MKYLRAYTTYESNFYDNTNSEKVIKYIQQKLDFITGKNKQDLDLSKLIYHFIIRGGGKKNEKLKQFVDSKSANYKKLIDSLLNYKPNQILKFYPNPEESNMVWLEAKFNRTHSKSDKTYNYYLTFTQTEENLTNFFNSISNLVTSFYEYCGKNRDFECGFKFGSDAEYFTTEKDHLKFYFYDQNNKQTIVTLVDNWLKKNGLLTDKRPYDHAVDAKDKTGMKTSFGDLVSKEIANHLEDIMQKNKDKFTAKQYYDWLIKFMSEAKYNIKQ